MKNKLLKIFGRVAGIASIMVLGMTLSSSVAYAGWNDAPSGECPTFSVGNVTQNNYGSSNGCWTATNVSARVGDIINLKVYFHNNTGSTVNNVKVKTTNNNGSTGNVNVAGTVYANDIAVASGYGTIALPANSKLVYAKTVVQYQRDNYAINDKGATSSIFSLSPGFQVGPLASTWADQGIVKVVYVVESTGSTATYQCNDNIDNDGDGRIDLADSGCSSSTDNDETNAAATYQCNDGIDNDNDGRIDLADSGCSSSTDNSEYVAPVQSNFVVNTNSPSLINSAQGSVTLEGSFANPVGQVDTCFIYGKVDDDAVTMVTGSYSGGSSSANFSKTLLNLPSGVYEYVACAADDEGQITGQPKQFTISRNNTNPQTNNTTVDTLNYRNLDIQNGSVTMVGRYYGVDGGVASVYFNYRRSGTSTLQTSSTQYYDSSREFSHSLSSLSSGNYDYQACIYYRGSEKCGSWESFSINRSNNNPVNDNTRPSVTTLSPMQIAADFVTMDGYYNMNGCSGTTYFEYGRTDSFGNRTNGTSRGQSGSMAQFVDGLTPGTTYYYRAVADNCAGTTYGSVRSFTTSNRTTVIRDNTPVIIGGGTTIVRNNTNTVRTNTATTTAAVVGTGARYVRLTIDNGRDTVAKGDELVYTVQWENISNIDLKDLVLEVSIPEALEIVSTEQGQIDKKANTIYVNISELRAGERDEMDVRAKVNGTLQVNESITARAIIAFENPELRSQENAIAYDSDSYITSQNVLGASIFGLDFLPGSLAGWLFIILLIILLILLIRYATGRAEQRNHYYHYDDDRGMPQPQAPVAPVASAPHNLPQDDYAPYRPTRKD
jgi:hypothetical protein